MIAWQSRFSRPTDPRGPPLKLTQRDAAQQETNVTFVGTLVPKESALSKLILAS